MSPKQPPRGPSKRPPKKASKQSAKKLAARRDESKGGRSSGEPTRDEEGRSGDLVEGEAVDAPPGDVDRLPIVGLGASAGGLEALEQFFSNLPAQTGVAFVVVTHQHAGQPSMLAEILSRETPMPVREVSRATRVAPDHVYTIRPGYDAAMMNGVLQPMMPDKTAPLHTPVDYFFRSLAQDRKDRAIGIILSGTGSDGSLGIKEIKGELGMVMVQAEESARYSGMPHSAIATGVVDYVLPAPEMPKQLLSYLGALRPSRAREARELEPPPEALRQIFVLIRDRTGHDFSQYKSSTVRRRIQRRMYLHHLESVARYVRFLQTNPSEIDLLFQELLIGVTSFFRDPDAWQALSAP